MNEKLNVRGLIIDLEGTIVDTSYFYFMLLKDAAKTTGIEFSYSLNDIQRIRDVEFDGLELIEMIAGEKKDEYIREIKNIYWDYNRRYARLFPESVDVLLNLIELGFLVSIYSNIHWSWDEIVRRYPMIAVLDGKIHYMNRHSVIKPKPSPEGVFKFCKIMKLNPVEVAVVGDSTDDIKMGRDAGTHTIGVLTGVSNAERLIKSGADLIIPEIGYLPDVVSR